LVCRGSGRLYGKHAKARSREEGYGGRLPAFRSRLCVDLATATEGIAMQYVKEGLAPRHPLQPRTGV